MQLKNAKELTSRTIFILLLGLSSISSNALTFNRKPIQIDHLNIEYAEKAGRGNVKELSYHFDDMSLFHTSLNANLLMTGKTLSITDGTTTFSVHNILDFINRFDTLAAQDLNFHFVNSKFTGWINQVKISLSNNSANVKDFKAKCGNDFTDVAINNDTLMFIFNMCFGEGKVEMAESTFTLDSGAVAGLTAFQENFAQEELERIEKEDPSQKALVNDLQRPRPKLDRLYNLVLNLKDKSYDLSFRVKLWLDFRVLIKGNVDFIPKASLGKGDETEGEFRVKIDEAKAGMIGVKKLVFKALQTINSPDFRVAPPYVYINYKAITRQQ